MILFDTEAKRIRRTEIKILNRESNTTKGKGISFMENNPKWHNGQISDEEYKIALKDLGYAEVE